MVNKNQQFNKINTCLRLIEKKLDWPDYQTWRHGDFIELSKLILEATKTNLSPTTLKRLTGKVASTYEPTRSVRNVLAIYIGYKDWEDFSINYPKDVLPPSKIIENKKNNSYLKPIIITLSILLLLLLIWESRKFIKRQHINHSQIQLRIKNKEGKIPHNSISYFNLKGFENEKVEYFYGGMGDILTPSFRLTNETIKRGSTINLFFYPGLRKAYIYINNKPVDSASIFSYTENWMGFINTMGLNRYPLLVEEDSIVKNGILYFSTNLLLNLKLDPYKIEPLIFNVKKDFLSVNADNMTVEYIIRNQNKAGSDACKKTNLNLLCEDGFIGIDFVNFGCSSTANLYYSDVRIEGRKTNLDFLQTNLNIWHTLLIKTIKMEIHILLDGKTIYKGKYKKKLKSFVGFTLKGFIEVDKIKLLNQKDEIVFIDEFSRN